MPPRYLSTALFKRAAANASLIRISLHNAAAPSTAFSRSFSAQPETNNKNSEPRVTTAVTSNGIVHVKLNRPDKLNALDLGMFEAIAETAESLAQDKSIRAVILSGEGRAFCTGLDVKSIAKDKPFKTMKQLLSKRCPESFSNLAQDPGYLWRQVRAPVICAIHGMCFGGGLQIALGADMRFATPDCKISIMEAKWGLIPDMSASVTLRELIPIDVAKELTMTGRIFSGQEAAALHLVTRCVDDPLAEAEKVAKEIAERNPDAVAASKKLFQNNWITKSEEEALKYEEELQRTLLGSWNQIATAVDNFGVKLPYINRKDGRE